MNYDNILKNIRLISNNQQPSEDITDLLLMHNCTYLLSKLSPNHFTKENLLNRICINERYKTCKDIFSIFESNNTPYAVIKGAVLSLSAYGDIIYRQSGDIDLLITRKNIDFVKQVMLEKGFIQGRVTNSGLVPFNRRELLFQSTMSHQTAPFIKETRNPLCPYVNVDVNLNVMWGESKINVDMDYVLAYTEPAEICGVKAQKLSCEIEFVSLCLHHYKDINSIYLLSQGSLKLSLFCDIYYYLKNNRLNLTRLHEICTRLCISDYIYYCLYYTHVIFNDSIIENYLNLLKTDKSRNLLNTFGLAEDEIKDWNISFPERLFMDDMENYFNQILSQKDLEKIQINKRLM